MSLWSKPEPSVFEKWPLRCTSRRASSSTGTTPTHAQTGLFSILLPQRNLPEGRSQVQCGEELGITKFREALVYSRYRARIFYRYRVQVAKVATKPKLPPFFFAITTPQAMAISRVLSCRIRATFLFPPGTLPIYVASFVLRLPYGERRLPQVRFRVRQNYSNRFPPYVLRIHPRSDLKPPVVARNLPRLFSPLSVLSLAKPLCQTLVYMTRGVPENSSEQIDMPSSVSDFIENNL